MDWIVSSSNSYVEALTFSVMVFWDGALERELDVVINFVCQLDWAMRCPDGWLDIVSGCVCEVVCGRD